MLVAEDDGNDLALFRLMVAEAAKKTGLTIYLQATRDGEETIEYLSGAGKFADRYSHPFPDIIVLDLKMPRLSGLEVLKWIKNHHEYMIIPKIMLSGSGEESDIYKAYRLCVNTYFQKPNSLEEYRELIHHLISYWAHTKRSTVKHSAN